MFYFVCLQFMAPLQSQDDLNMAIDIVDRSPHMRSLRVFLSQGGSGPAHSPQHGQSSQHVQHVTQHDHAPGRLGQLFDKVSTATKCTWEYLSPFWKSYKFYWKL